MPWLLLQWSPSFLPTHTHYPYSAININPHRRRPVHHRAAAPATHRAQHIQRDGLQFQSLLVHTTDDRTGCVTTYVYSSNTTLVAWYVPYVHTIMLCHNFLIGKAQTCARMTTTCVWEDSRQPVERRNNCRVTHTYTLATALTPLPQRRGLPRESPPHCPYVRTRVPLIHMYVRPLEPRSWS